MKAKISEVNANKRLFIRVIGRLALLGLLATSIVVAPQASAAAPTISTTWSIANGALSPVVIVEGTNFASDNDKFDFTVDMGTTNLEYDSVAYIDDKHMRFNFHEIANAGTITIQANASAFSPLATEASNTISIVVPVPLIPQSISFIQPSSMKVKEKDQTPKATSTSDLAVVLTSNTPSVCTIDFLKIHAVAAGTCSITANVNGNSIYSRAIPVTRSFEVIAMTSEEPESSKALELKTTNLGSLTYDPKITNGAYVSVLVEGESAEANKATLVKVLIPPRATEMPVVFLISSLSSDAETSEGYFVARIKAISSDGVPVSRFKKGIEINIPSGAVDGFPSWSHDGLKWYKLVQLEQELLPPNLHAGYFVEKDGRIAIFTDYLMLFGFRKIQAPLTISAPALSIEANHEVQLSSTGGSGNGEIKFFTRTDEFCITTPGGVLKGIKSGKCIVAATKDGSGIYAHAAASAISIFILEKPLAIVHDPSDPNHLIISQELSYTELKSSTNVYVNLCEEAGGEMATLEIGSKSSTGKMTYKVVGTQELDTNGTTIFTMHSVLKNGQILRVKAEGKVQIAVVISGKYL
jgi:hypothetical protein